MASEPRDPAREARDRVALRQDRETKALSELQRQERERDSDRQNRALENSLANQANVESDKEKALAAHEKRWKEASDRLTPRPIPAPGFDMIGPPLRRNLVQDHDEIRQRRTEGRDQIVKDYDQRIAACETARAEMQQGFGRANEARDQAHSEARRGPRSTPAGVVRAAGQERARSRRQVDQPRIQTTQPRRRRAGFVRRSMYRYSQTLPGGPITLVGIIVLSFLVPGWVANALGFGAANAQLVDWILSHRVISCIALLLVYGLGGFVLLVGAGMAVFVAYVVLIRALIAVRNWAVRASIAAIRSCSGALLYWSLRIVRRTAVGSNPNRVPHSELDRTLARAASAAAALPRGIRRGLPLLPRFSASLARASSRRAGQNRSAATGDPPDGPD